MTDIIRLTRPSAPSDDRAGRRRRLECGWKQAKGAKDRKLAFNYIDQARKNAITATMMISSYHSSRRFIRIAFLLPFIPTTSIDRSIDSLNILTAMLMTYDPRRNDLDTKKAIFAAC